MIEFDKPQRITFNEMKDMLLNRKDVRVFVPLSVGNMWHFMESEYFKIFPYRIVMRSRLRFNCIPGKVSTCVILPNLLFTSISHGDGEVRDSVIDDLVQYLETNDGYLILDEEASWTSKLLKRLDPKKYTERIYLRALWL